MKQTYLKIYTNAQQPVGLAPVSEQLAEELNNQGLELQNLANEILTQICAMIGGAEAEGPPSNGANLSALEGCIFSLPDGNPDSPFYTIAGEGPTGLQENWSCSGPGYVTNGWLYPVNASRGLFIMNITNNGDLTPTPCLDFGGASAS